MILYFEPGRVGKPSPNSYCFGVLKRNMHVLIINVPLFIYWEPDTGSHQR